MSEISVDPGCCDTYCTSFQIWYLRVMRPGDTVQFNQSPKILTFGIAQAGCGVMLIILDLLAIFCQFKELTSPSPSFLGAPGVPVWISLLILLSGFGVIIAYKRKDRFVAAISFGCSALAVLMAISLMAVITMSIAQEVDYYDEKNKSMGIVIGTIMSIFVLAEVVITSSTALLGYLALTSHDDRWFTDRGTQHFQDELVIGSSLSANMTIPISYT
ncbi:uncharacterized protein LOC144425178 [Styela clava]